MNMRILLAVLAVAVLTGAAAAQDMGGKGGKGRSGSQQNSNQQNPDQKKKIDDAYKSAVGRIPDSKEKYDPWKNAR
jgi:hypothetical protein